MADTRERPAFQSSQVTSMIRGGGLDIESPTARWPTEDMILNIGPQHPSTHGVLRVVLELDGEVIVRAEPVIGYMHRAAEKLAEFRDARQTMVLMNRHDWISAFNNELGFVIAVERLAGIEVPERAQWIRTMFAEWNRILNHLMFCGSYPLELGAMTPIFYAFREREMIQDLMESAHRRAHAPLVLPRRRPEGRPAGRVPAAIGRRARSGAQDDPRLRDADHGQRDHLRALPQHRRAAGRDGGGLRHERARCCRRAASPMDPRKDEPYEKYGEVEFDVPVGQTRRQLRPAVGAGRAHEAELQHHRAVHGQAPGRASSARRSCRRR